MKIYEQGEKREQSKIRTEQIKMRKEMLLMLPCGFDLENNSF